MPDMNTKNFTTLVQEQAAAIQARSNKLLDFVIGSILRAMVESNSTIILWLQGLVLKVLATTRAATSSGTDLDSWVNDFGVYRLSATASTGSVVFSRFTPDQNALIPVGSQVQTSDGSQRFVVVADPLNSAYQAGQNAYLLASGISQLSVPVQATVPSAGSNVQPGAVNTILSAIPGVDTVTNVAAFTNGSDAESDAALRTRFLAYLASLSKATRQAVGYAVTSLQLGIQYTLVENQNYAGQTDLGYFYLVIDDGTGAPPSDLLARVYAAVDLVRAVTIRFGVFAPIVVNANVAMAIVVKAGYDSNTVKGLVGQAITKFVNSLPLGEPLRYTRLAEVAYGASPGVDNVTNVLLNSGTADLTATAKQVIKAQTVTVS